MKQKGLFPQFAKSRLVREAPLTQQGPDADARRQKAMPKIAEDLTRVPDHLFGGPELPLDENVWARFFGEC
jgi:hypothetical protein